MSGQVAKTRGRVWRWLINLLLILLLIGGGASSVYYLRQNNLEMLEARQAVFDADQADGDVSSALTKLQQYVVSHMNTALPKLGDEKEIQLKYTYERAVAAEAASVSSQRSDLYETSTEYCQKTYASASFAVRSQCVQDYSAAHPIKTTEIPKDAYGYDFVTPFWSPDRAGYSLLVTAVIAVLIIFRFLAWLIVRRSLKLEQ